MLSLIVRHLVSLGLLLVLGCHSSEGIGPTPASSDLTTMNIGEVRVFNPANVWNGLQLASSTSAREFLLIVGNTNPEQDVVENYVVQIFRPMPGSLGIAAASNTGARLSSFANAVDRAGTLQQALDSKLRAFERSGLTLQSPVVPLGISALSSRRSNRVATGALTAPGDTLSIKIPDGATTDLCASFIPTKAVVASVSRRAILAVDTLDGPPLALFSQAVLDSITQEFDNVTYPTDSAYFNNPTDIDGNGRVIIVFSGQINKLTPPGQKDFVGGFFFAGDFFPTTGTKPGTFCPQSNRAEIFYLLAPDPTGRFNNVRTTSSVRQGTRGTIAHEFQHMINAGNRYLNPAVEAFEVTWLDEALAHFAEDAVGRAQRGFTDLQTLTFADLVPSGNAQASSDFTAFFYQNLARLTYWMLRPDTSSGISARADKNLSSRGAGWAILRYTADTYSNGNPRALTRELAAGPDTGVTNFTVATQAPIDSLVAGWLVSMYADHLGIPGLDPKYQYRSYNFQDVMPPVASALLAIQTGYPLQVIPLGSGRDTVASTNRSGTGTYYTLGVIPTSGAVTVRFVSPMNQLLNCCIQVDKEWRTRLAYPGAHVYVLRTR
jgi:hypothetical protein